MVAITIGTPSMKVDGWSEPVIVTKRRDSSGWRRIRVGSRSSQISLILDDQQKGICVLHPWICKKDIDKLIIALQVAADVLN